MVAFGTSGLRGLAVDLVAGPGYRHAGAFAYHLLATGVIDEGSPLAIGMDRRESSPLLAAQTMHAVRAAGLRPVFYGVLPTPALALQALADGIPAIMVTGSHIPPDRNGLKFYRPDGEIDKKDELAIAAAAPTIDAADLPADEWPQPDPAARIRYLERYRTAFAGKLLSGWRIGVWRHSSVAADILVDLLHDLGAETVELGASGEFVAVDTEAIDPDAAERLAGWSRHHRLDAIVSTDGDGDRPLLVDDRGEIVRGDTLGLLVARYVGADVVVTPVSSNPGITSALGFDVVRTRIGSPFVIEGMAAADQRGYRGVLGFEANGGVLLGSDVSIGGGVLPALPTRDSVLPLLSALAAAGQGRSVAALVDGLKLPACASGRIEDFPRADADRLLAWIDKSPANMERFLAGNGAVSRVEVIDGTQIHLENGSMIHLRPSGNAPEMRCYVSAPDAPRAQALLAFGLERIRSFEDLVGENEE
jgi:phosphomannomutase